MSHPQAGPLVGILLAAGSGSRFGSDKRLHPLVDGTAMAVASARNLRAVCDRVVVVVSPGSEALVSLLAEEGIEALVGEASALGMGHSLAAGVRATPQAAAWLVALADMPFIAASTYERVVVAMRDGASIAAPIFHGRRGHPVGFARAWYEQLAELKGDEGARIILIAAKDAMVHCEVEDENILRDIDTPADLTR
jgi:molybdenum cofactor cytidylyltransferase